MKGKGDTLEYNLRHRYFIIVNKPFKMYQKQKTTDLHRRVDFLTTKLNVNLKIMIFHAACVSSVACSLPSLNG